MVRATPTTATRVRPLCQPARHLPAVTTRHTLQRCPEQHSLVLRAPRALSQHLGFVQSQFRSLWQAWNPIALKKSRIFF